MVGMYLRTTQRKNTDGSIVRYVHLAHNRRVDGVTQAEVLVNLGREDRLDREGLRRLVALLPLVLACCRRQTALREPHLMWWTSQGGEFQ